MPADSKFSFARLLTLLLDPESRPIWLPALWVPLLFGGFFWVLTKVSKPPAKAENTKWAYQLNVRALITDKYLDVRHEPILVIEEGSLLKRELDWGNTFFSADTLEAGFRITSRQEYEALERYSLVACAQVGDSLLKRSGDSTALLKRGRQLRVFHFHSLWP